jgi:Protein of unknown function (DUF3592)
VVHNLYGILIGVAMAYTSGHALVVSLRRRRGTVRATGTVLGVEKVPNMGGPMLPSGSDGLSVTGFGPDYKPVIQFTAPDGGVVRFRSKLQMNANAMALFGRRYRPGHHVPVRYRPDDPQQALLDTALATWVIGVIVLVAGLALTAVSALTG